MFEWEGERCKSLSLSIDGGKMKRYMSPADFMDASAKIFAEIERLENRIGVQEERLLDLLEMACNYPVPERLRPMEAKDLRRGRIAWDLPKEGEVKEKPYWLNVTAEFDKTKGTFIDGVFGDEYSIEGLQVEAKDE